MNTTPTIGFVFEQTLGHVTHTRNLQNALANDGTITPRWCPVTYPVTGVGSFVPVFKSNWTVRSGIRARRSLRATNRETPLDALFIHTQVPAVLIPDWLRRIPSVVSIDATPIQYDQLGEHYAHRPGRASLENLKWRANRACFQRAAAIVAWSSWAKDSLVNDYDVPEHKVTVIPPVVWSEDWSHPRIERSDDGVVRILFVGADFSRKGGATLLDAFRKVVALLGDDPLAPTVELHLVTKSTVAPERGVHVHADLDPNAAELLDLYSQCDVFCLPTRADMLALVLCEAGAAGLPLISTTVGGIPEIVSDNDTGFLVPPDDVDALFDAMIRLIEDPALRRRLGSNAAATVAARFDATHNAQQLVELLRRVASGRS